jgi:hydrogenase maturation protein HypF
MRMKLEIIGAVQGVGFRPFVYRLAKELDLRGWIINTPEGVKIEVEGENLDVFLKRLQEEKPPLAYIYSISFEYAEEVGYTDFEIKESHSEGKRKFLYCPMWEPVMNV